MYEIRKVKHIVDETKPLHCHACLSSDRKLTNIAELDEHIEIFASICKNAIKMSSNLYLCWECVAVLRKIKLFQLRIEKAQSIIADHCSQKQTSTVRSLSKLSITTANTPIFITKSDDETIETKENLTIKEESHDANDECNFDATDHNFEEIKKEDKPQIKSVKRNKVTHYKIVYGQGVFQKRMLRKKFVIKSEDIALWLEKEKDSKFYKCFKFRCKMCFHGYTCKEKLQKHHMECHDMSLGAHECVTCHSRFPTALALSAHERVHLFGRECAGCGFKCYSARRLGAHIDTHRMFQCVYCELCLTDLRSFQQHYKCVHGAFVCDHCGKRTKTKYMLEKHIIRHMTIHKCHQCGRQYQSRGALNKHVAVKHSGDAPELAYCVRCDKQFSSALVYRRHVHSAAAHALETRALVKKKVSCPECANTYSRRAYMMNHYRHVHTNQSKHYCDTCDRHFLNRTRYVEHMRFNHEGAARDKNKLCNVCGRGFTTNRILLNHIRTHSGERPFQCDYCSAKFTQKHSMLSHVKYVHLKTKRRPVWQQ